MAWKHSISSSARRPHPERDYLPGELHEVIPELPYIVIGRLAGPGGSCTSTCIRSGWSCRTTLLVPLPLEPLFPEPVQRRLALHTAVAATLARPFSLLRRR